MTAYGFKDRFALQIIAGTKISTIRRPRAKGHVKVGGDMQLYVGFRTKGVKKIIPDVTCVYFRKIVLYPAAWRVNLSGVDLAKQPTIEFARAEGFETMREFFGFFQETYPEDLKFEGVNIMWADPRTQYPYLAEALRGV